MSPCALWPALLPQRGEPDEWVKWIAFALFFGFPLLARAVKALRERAGQARAGGAPAQEERARRRELRAERREVQTQGEDLWRRLARGEVSAPPAAAPSPAPSSPPSPSARPALAQELSLESEDEPRPLSVLGEVSEPSEAPELSLETEGEPAPLAVMAATRVESLEPRSRAAFRLARGDLRRAIVLSEVLGAPVSERSLRA